MIFDVVIRKIGSEMKKVNLLLALLCIPGIVICYGQPDKIVNPPDSTRKEFGISAGIYNNHIFRFSELRKTGRFDDGPGMQYGINLMVPMDSHMSMGFGLYYLKTENLYHSLIQQADVPEKYTHYSEIAYLPVRLQYNITNWFAIHGGLSISIEFQDDNNLNQNGMGIIGGASFNYSPSSKLNIGIEPEVQVTSIFPVPQEFYQRHFLLAGINTRVAWSF